MCRGVAFVLLCLGLSCINSLFASAEMIKPFVVNGTYRNYEGENPRGYFLKCLKVLACECVSMLSDCLRRGRGYFPPDFDANEWVSLDEEICEFSEEPTITWIGHATVLIQIGGINILTDPVFGDIPMCHVPCFGSVPYARRIFPPGIELDNLPPIDVVLISHVHPDHFDRESLARLYDRFPRVKFLVPEGVGKLLHTFGFEEDCFKERTWGESGYIKQKEMSFTCVPAFHFGKYNATDRINSSLWCGWWIRYGELDIYFAGDTAYHEPFIQNIYENLGSPDVALLPVGPVFPRGPMRCMHLSGADVISAARQLGARTVIPIHWGTFRQGSDRWFDPIDELSKAYSTDATTEDTLAIMPLCIGKPYMFPKIGSPAGS